MATFLTTEAMAPALRDRLERAVSSRSRARFNARKMGLSGPFAAGEGSHVAPHLAPLTFVGLALDPIADRVPVLDRSQLESD